MREVFEKVGLFIEGGSYGVVIPLLVLCLLVWVITLERLYFLGEVPWIFLSEAARRKRKEARAALERSLGSFLKAPTGANRQALLLHCESLSTPLTAFALRFLRHRPSVLSAAWRPQLQEAALVTRREIEKNLNLLPLLTSAALLLAVVGTVSGLAEAFRGMPASAGAAGASSWQGGLTMALTTTELGLATALCGVLGRNWLVQYARRHESEIRSWIRGLESLPGRVSREASVAS